MEYLQAILGLDSRVVDQTLINVRERYAYTNLCLRHLSWNRCIYNIMLQLESFVIYSCIDSHIILLEHVHVAW